VPNPQPKRDVMNEVTTRTFVADAAGLGAAASLLAGGGLVAFPTETVYGLGVDARNSDAVARLYAAKGRPSFNPLIVHVSSIEAAEKLVEFDDTARDLARAFWPGALTLVLPLRADAGVSSLVTAGLSTLAIRVPDHPVAQRLLVEFGGPVAAPSANPSGQVSPTKFDHVADQMTGRIDGIVAGGECAVGLESTIVATHPTPTLLRAGGVPSEVSPSGDLVEAAANLFDAFHQLNALNAAHIAVSPIPDHGLGRAINDRLKRAAAPRSG